MAKIKKWFYNNHVSTYVFDSIVLSILILLLVFKDCLPSIRRYDVTTNIIISLIPALMTIISLAIQIQNEPIYGTTLRKFERLRKGFYFVLIHMILIFVTVFGLETAFTFIKFEFGLMTLNVMSIIYSIIFIFQEIPIFLKIDFFVNRIIRKISFNTEVGQQEMNSDGQIIITNLIMTYGIEEAYNKLSTKKSDKKEILERLINFELDYYKTILKKMGDGDDKEKVTYCGIDIIDAVDSSYNDLTYLFDKKHRLNVSFLDNDYYGLVNLTFCLKKVTDKLGYSKKNTENLKSLINHLHIIKFSKKLDEMIEIYRYLLLMSLFTIKHGEKWFITLIRDTDFSPLFFDIEEYPFVYLLTMYMCFFIHSSIASEKEKENIKSFLYENSKGINSAGYIWIDKIKESFRNNMNGNAYLNGIKQIVKIKELLPDSYYDITPKYGGIYTVDDSTHFGNRLLFDYCLQMLFFNYIHNVKEQDVEEFLNSFSDKNKNKLIEVFGERFSNLEANKYSKSFYTMFFESKSNINITFNIPYKTIESYRTEKLTSDYENDDSNNFDDEKIENVKKTIDEEMPKIFESIDFNNNDLAVKKDKKFYFRLLLEANDYEQLLNLYLKHLDNSIDFDIRKEIESKTKPIEIVGYKYDKDSIENIIKFEPKYSGDIYRLDMTTSDKEKELLKDIKTVSRDLVPPDTFIKEDAIQIRYLYCPEDSIPRRLKDEEIEDMIQRDYPISNGYYRYSKYKGSSTGNFYVTKEKLISYLRKRYIFVPIVYSSNIEIDESKIKRFTFKE